MSAAELQLYEFQLAQVEASLKTDPANAELKTLAKNLRELVEATEQLLKQARHHAPAPAATVASTAGPAGPATVPDTASSVAGEPSTVQPHQFKIGDKCEALYNDDKKWYTAEVQAVSKDGMVYTVLYDGYNETGVVKAANVRLVSKEALKRQADMVEEAERKKKEERKKVKQERTKERNERTKEADQELKAKQSSWQSFAQKRAKVIPGVSQKSIFATPESVHGKVGVVGSGKGITEFGKRKKHEFAGDEGEGPSAS